MSTLSIRSGSRSVRSRRAIADINVVPYIDVMLVLLVIFMVTAPLVTPSIIDLPSVGQTAPQHRPLPIIVTVRANGSLSVREQNSRSNVERVMSKAELKLFLRAQQQALPALPVVIAADKNIRYQTVMDMMSDLKAQGIQRIGLLVRSGQ